MTTSAKIIADSIQANGQRITTLELVYPRFIHGEVMTHRVFSRNAMSSRAIPVAKMIEEVRTNPAQPCQWDKNQPGMQAKELLGNSEAIEAISEWLKAAENAADSAEKLAKLGVSKQIANRLLEPFQWMRTIVTATQWGNFFALRAHPDAQPDFQKLAYLMQDTMVESKPASLAEDEWHLPYITVEDLRLGYSLRVLLQVSAARCARVSYLTHDKQRPTIDADLTLFNRLAGSHPIHASPLEHQACPAGIQTGLGGNLGTGWIQFRKLLETGQM